MKVYVVYRSEGEYSEIRRAFLNEETARKYVTYMNERTDYGWHHEELEVEG